MSSFDPLNFSAKSNKSIGSFVPSATSQFAGNISNALSGSGLSIESIKNVVASSVGAITSTLTSGLESISSLVGVNATRADPAQLISQRSRNSFSDPIPKILNSREGQSTFSATYPPTLGGEFLQVEFSKYDRPGPLTQVNFSPVADVKLPLPAELKDMTSVDLSSAATGGAEAVVSQIKSIAQEVQGTGTGSMADLLKDSAGLGYYGLSSAANKFGSTLSSIVPGAENMAGMAGQALGVIPNPHLSVFFQGVQIRQDMEFSWLFSPRNFGESMLIREIVNKFKQLTLPPVDTHAQNLMGYPHMVRLTLHPWDEMSSDRKLKGLQTMPVYKLGLIRSMQVNYSPNGLTFFKTDPPQPTFVVFTFTFTEIEVFTANDYGNGGIDTSKIEKQIGQLTQGVNDATTAATGWVKEKLGF
jgi:hypothetical protein